MKKFENKKQNIRKVSVIKLTVLSITLLSSLSVFANDDWEEIMIPGGGGNPNDAPIDTPYFWALLLLLGAYVAYKKLQPKTT